MDYTNIKFDRNTSNVDFYKTLQKKVRKHFKDTNSTKYGNASMVIKSIFMLALYLVPYFMILTVVESVWLSLLMWALMALGMSGIGLSIMHDANHGAYSKSKFVNNLMGDLISVVGGSDAMWRIQHNVLHHTYTNVSGMDEDIDPGSVLRFSPHEERKPFHKYQHYYAWFLYGLMTILWCTVKDFKQAIRYKKLGLTKTEGASFSRIISKIVVHKVLYHVIFLVLPLIFSPVAWYFTVLGFLLMHFMTGVILGLIFQSAHVVPTSNFPMPDETGNIKADWAVSQLINTCNFAPDSKILSWYVGGLNFQVEHHLFPNICHVHYKRISKIVRETAEEFGLPYNSEKTFGSAIKSHAMMLKKLGNQDQL
ncbi:fatty acid desaturase family protein [Brumimicrobium oceani]|uniref:Acyl-CoA desaturase n=1 Tax=Brumimicrobium oceani TaxID=2100725 RepID=A0A2U2XDK3_9FLAO|nr:acyl-CoA desaturase [Brumimicrobium oceani]PWH85853.1 acyl-CoA desaturase [Brumimicrobium oceani]